MPASRTPGKARARAARGKRKYVYSFSAGRAEGGAADRDLLGGKGANLAEMCRLEMPVPPGFVLSTEVCAHYYANGRRYPRELEGQVEQELGAL
jgi:pyruvate,orthophosphate dikinase